MLVLMINKMQGISLGTALFLTFFPQGSYSQEILPAEELRISPSGLIANNCTQQWPEYVPQTGDIIAHTSQSRQSELIKAATFSDYTHMGLVVEKKGQYFVLEALSTVKYTPLREWVQRGVNGKYTVKRLVLPDFDLEGIISGAEEYLGKKYDSQFDPDEQKIYCSELVQKAYAAVGISLGRWELVREMPGLKDSHVAQEAQRRWGVIPKDLRVVTPASIMESPYLTTVYTNFN